MNFLDSIRGSAKNLFILGDLFDSWFEYKYVIQKGYYMTFTALKELSDTGCKIHYIIGNHDFLHRNFFETEFGAEMYQDALSLVLDGKKFFLGHGDGLVKNDVGYLILKKFLRNRIIQNIYSFIHPDIGLWLASTTSKKSRDYTAGKSYGEIDGVFESAKNKIRQGYNYVLFGHTHHRSYEKYESGIYINLGSWLNKPCYGVFSNNEFKIIDL